MKAIYTDEQIQALTNAFLKLDFSQPNAHKVFHELEKPLETMVVKEATWREYYFFKLGRSATLAKSKFDTIPPLQIISQAQKETTK